MCNYAENAKQAVADTHTSGKIMGYYRTTPLEEMEKRCGAIQEDHAKLSEAIEFLRANPQFNDFIALIRKGAISI